MAQENSGGTFHFINSSDSRGPQDPATRKTIRKQAMVKVAAARREKGQHGKVNSRQYPVFVEIRQRHDGESSSSFKPNESRGSSNEVVSSSRVTNEALISPLLLKQTIPASPSSTGYESMRIQYDFDILDLSALTSFHAGHTTAHALKQDPARLVDVLHCRQWSYLSFVPSKFGNTSCLDDAVRCVAAKVRHRLSSPTQPPNTVIISLYSKALGSLQNALNDKASCLEPDILCATEILAIYELLDSTSNEAWVRHIAGATSLVKFRGPQGYNTAFEKALFLAHAGPTFTETLLQAKPCFLEEDRWQTVFRSVLLDAEPFADCSGIVINLWTQICPVPRLFGEVESVFTQPEQVDILAIQDLTRRLHQHRDSLVKWALEYEAIASQYPKPSSKQVMFDKRYETLGVVMGMRIVMNRLLLSLNANLADELEPESQSFAHRIFDLQQQAYATNPRAGIFIAFKMVVARATIETRADWCTSEHMADLEGNPRQRTIPKEVFAHWCALKRKDAASCSKYAR